jgi:uncharacterized UPF0160 family protein
MSKPVMLTYVTHGGLHHADEVAGWTIVRGSSSIGCNLLRLEGDQWDSLEKLKALAEKGLDTEEIFIVADIGRECDPERNLFDHHQGLILRDNGYPYASAGLLWRKFGLEYIVRNCGVNLNSTDLLRVKKIVDKDIIQGLDASDADNKFKVNAECVGGPVQITTLSRVISTFNKDGGGRADKTNAFLEAGRLVEQVLNDKIAQAVKRIRAERLLEEAYVEGQGYLVMEEGLPWKKFVHKNFNDLRYIIAPSSFPASEWAMIAVTVEPSSRECIIPIERSPDFEEFIHEGKWIAGSNSLEALINLAEFNLTR